MHIHYIISKLYSLMTHHTPSKKFISDVKD